MDQAKRLKDLEKENGKLKRLEAELALDKQTACAQSRGLAARNGAGARPVRSCA